MKLLLILLVSLQLFSHAEKCPCQTGEHKAEEKIEYSEYSIGKLKKLKWWVAPGFTLSSSNAGSSTGLNLALGANYFFNGIVGFTTGVSYMQRGFQDTPFSLSADYIDIPLGITFVNRGHLSTNQFTLLSIGLYYALPLSGESDFPATNKSFDPEGTAGFFFDGIMSFPIKGKITYGLYSSVKFSFDDMIKAPGLGSNNPTNYSFGLAIVY